MGLGNGATAIPTLMGSFLSLAFFAIIIWYAFIKADVLINKKDVDVTTAINDMTYDSDYVFNAQNGFNIAAAFVSYDGDFEFLDPKYGSLIMNHYRWG